MVCKFLPDGPDGSHGRCAMTPGGGRGLSTCPHLLGIWFMFFFFCRGVGGWRRLLALVHLRLSSLVPCIWRPLSCIPSIPIQTAATRLKLPPELGSSIHSTPPIITPLTWQATANSSSTSLVGSGPGLDPSALGDSWDVAQPERQEGSSQGSRNLCHRRRGLYT